MAEPGAAVDPEAGGPVEDDVHQGQQGNQQGEGGEGGPEPIDHPPNIGAGVQS